MAGSAESRLGSSDRPAAVEAFRERLISSGVVDAPTNLTDEEFEAAVFGGRELLICRLRPYLNRARRILSRLTGKNI